MRISPRDLRVTAPLFATIMFCLSTLALPLQSLAQTGPAAQAESPDDRYGLGADSLPQPGVPTGTVSEFTLADSTIYPGSPRANNV